MTLFALHLDGRRDLINIAGAEIKSHMRIKYDACPCALPGDVNADGEVNGCDIQPFVDCYIDRCPDLCHECSCADMNQDLILDEADLQCFVDRLLLYPCDFDACLEAQPGGGGAQFGQESSSQGGIASASSLPAPTYQISVELLAAFEAHRAWVSEHPRNAYPELSKADYWLLVRANAVENGLLDPGD